MGSLTALVLGAAAGGGVPQWNCRCDVCRLAWAGDPRVKPRTQATLAASADAEAWVLINASPDLRTQIAANPALHPRREPRGSPIAAVILTGAEIDQTAGLLSLRESAAFALYATDKTHAALVANPMFSALSAAHVSRHTVRAAERFAPVENVEAELFAVPGKAPLYLEGNNPDLKSESGVNVGVELRAGGARLVYVPGAAAVTPALRQRFDGAQLIMFDGTLYRDDEMISSGTGSKTARRMGHMPIDGEDGSLAALADVAARRIYVHINNTNPILVEGSPERHRVEAAGWEVAEDGMRIVL